MIQDVWSWFFSLTVIGDLLTALGEASTGIVDVFIDVIAAIVAIFYGGEPAAITVPGYLGLVAGGVAVGKKMFNWVRGLFQLRG